MTVTNSYWDTQTSGWSSTVGGGTGYTTTQLKAPTGYNGIYSDWNLDLDGDGTPDRPWRFPPGAYPVLGVGPALCHRSRAAGRGRRRARSPRAR